MDHLTEFSEILYNVTKQMPECFLNVPCLTISAVLLVFRCYKAMRFVKSKIDRPTSFDYETVKK